MLTAALVSHTADLHGAERMLLNLAQLLRKTGAVRPVLLIPGSGELSKQARGYGVRYELIPALPWHVYGAHDSEQVNRLTDVLTQSFVEMVADVVLINTVTSVAPVLAAVQLGLPSVVWVHGILDSAMIPERDPPLSVAQDQVVLQSATRVVVNSTWTKRFCEDTLACSNTDLIHNWTRLEAGLEVRAEKYRGHRFACLNRFEAHKGEAVLIEAASLLRERGVPFELELYGDGPLRATMLDRVGRLGLAKQVRFQARAANVDSVYDQALCIINPSYVESFGMTLIEAMARKTPVIAAASGGPQEIIEDGASGFLVERGDVVALADRMQHLLANPEAARLMGERGFARVEAFFSEAVARDRFLRLIGEVVETFRGYDPRITALVDVYRALNERMATERAIAESMTLGYDREALETHAPPSTAEQIGAFPLDYVPLSRPRCYRITPRLPCWLGVDVTLGTPLNKLITGLLLFQIQLQNGLLVREGAARFQVRNAAGNRVRLRFPELRDSAGQSFLLTLRLAEPRPDGVGIFEVKGSRPLRERVTERLRRSGVRSMPYLRLVYDG